MEKDMLQNTMKIIINYLKMNIYMEIKMEMEKNMLIIIKYLKVNI